MDDSKKSYPALARALTFTHKSRAFAGILLMSAFARIATDLCDAAKIRGEFRMTGLLLLAQQDAYARARGQTDRRNIAFRWLPVLRGIL